MAISVPPEFVFTVSVFMLVLVIFLISLLLLIYCEILNMKKYVGIICSSV